MKSKYGSTKKNSAPDIKKPPAPAPETKEPQRRVSAPEFMETRDTKLRFKPLPELEPQKVNKTPPHEPLEPVKKGKHSPKTAYRSADEQVTKLSLLESNRGRILGEIAFQLDKRILSFVLNGKFNRDCKYKSFYGYNVANLQQRIVERETGEIKEVMLDRYTFLMKSLLAMGYIFPQHANFAVTLVNKYGVMKQNKEDTRGITISIHDEALLRGLVRGVCAPNEIKDSLTLLQCLTVLAADDGLPLFVW